MKLALVALMPLVHLVTAGYMIVCDTSGKYPSPILWAECGDAAFRGNGGGIEDGNFDGKDAFDKKKCSCSHSYGYYRPSSLSSGDYTCAVGDIAACTGQGVGCGCVETTEPPTTEAATKMATEPPTSEAPTTEPPTSEDPAKASTKAPTDAPDEKQTPAPPTTSKPDEKQTPAPPTTSTQTPTDALTKAPTDAPAGASPGSEAVSFQFDIPNDGNQRRRLAAGFDEAAYVGSLAADFGIAVSDISVFLSPPSTMTTVTTVIIGVTAAAVKAFLLEGNALKNAALAAGVAANYVRDMKIDQIRMVELTIPADPQGAVAALLQLGLSVSMAEVAGLVAAAGANEGGGTPTPAGLALAWPKYPGRNCYWENHGAEEVDYPWGKAVAKAKTLHACQAACVEAADFGCHGVLFQAATGNCYRKKDIVVEKCVRDESVDLYVRPSATVFVDRLE